MERELRGPVLAAYEDAVGVMDGGQMHGLAVGSWQDCLAEVEALAGEAAAAMARLGVVGVATRGTAPSRHTPRGVVPWPQG